jgi:Family of unknown function (DUF5686)/CarboxypepD_reg-like domain
MIFYLLLSRIKPCWLIGTFLMLSSSMMSQVVIKGRVLDADSKEPIPFVCFSAASESKAYYSDIDGYYSFEMSSPDVALRVSYLGYTDLEITAGQLQRYGVIKLRSNQKMLEEVVIKPGVNPAERIVKRAIENKVKNDPEKNISFSYDSYNKLFFDLDMVKVPDMDTTTPPAIDLSKQHIFLVETVSTRKHLPPDHSEEVVVATRVSGLENPDFAVLGTQIQSFSFYGETVQILGSTYMSPLHDDAIKKYLFIVEDTTVVDRDTVFVVSFRPRKGTNFQGMKGQLFIHTNGYALQNVVAEPNDRSVGMYVKIEQQYELIQGRFWFPVQLVSTFENELSSGGRLVGEGRSYMQNIQLREDLNKKDFSPVTLYMDETAIGRPDSLWNTYRYHQLDDKDLKTYHVIDSLGKAEHLDRKVQMMQAVSEGYIPIGVVSWDINRLMAFNSYEGFRLGAGLHTNQKLMKRARVGGYVAYGFKDKSMKYGGDVKYFIRKVRDMWISAAYENDVRETAGNQFALPAVGLSTRALYPLFINRMDRYELMEMRFNGRWWGNLSGTLFLNHQRVRPFEGINYLSELATQNEGVVIRQRDFQLSESGVVLRYAPGEKFVRVGDRELSLGGRFPVFYLRYTKGWKNVLDGEFDYHRWDLMVEKSFYWSQFGEFKTRLVAGTIGKDLPYSLYYNVRGAFNNWSVFAPDGFETMRTNEFVHSSFVAVQLRHNFKDLLFSRPQFKPHVVLVHNMMYGKSIDQPRFDIVQQSADKGYFESGLQLDNLLQSSFSALGVGCYYRYGPYHLPEMKENFSFKLTSTIVF